MEKNKVQETKKVCFNTPTGNFRRSSLGSKKVKGAFKSPLRQDSGAPKPGDTASLRCEVERLQARNQELDKEIQELMEEGYREEELQVHIGRLHDYNEMKDLGQMVLGRLAIQKGVTTKDLYPQYGLDLED